MTGVGLRHGTALNSTDNTSGTNGLHSAMYTTERSDYIPTALVSIPTCAPDSPVQFVVTDSPWTSRVRILRNGSQKCLLQAPSN